MAVQEHRRRGVDGGGELFREYGPLVLRLCRYLLRDPEEAEDAAQQVFLRAYRALEAGVRPIHTRAWLLEIARNECRARAHAAAGRREAPLTDAVPALDDDPADLVARDALLARVQLELAELPGRQREAILLREIRGLSYDELAAAMDTTQPAVESLLQRARHRLAQRLAGARRALGGAAIVAESVRGALARLLPPGGTEAATGAGAAALLAKVAATGAVAVVVGVSGGDRQPVVSPPPRPQVATTPTPSPSSVAEPERLEPSANNQGEAEHVRSDDNDNRSGSHSGDTRSQSDDGGSTGSGLSGSSGSGSGGETSRSLNSGPGSVSSGSSSDSSGSSGSGSDRSGSGSDSGSDSSNSGSGSIDSGD